MRLAGSRCDGQRLRVAKNEDGLGIPLQGPKHCSLTPTPLPQAAGYWFLLLVARIEKSLGF